MRICRLAVSRGTRLGSSAELTNKALLPPENKAILLHIIEQFAYDDSLAVAVGHQQAQIRDYIMLAHPDLKVSFVEVGRFYEQPMAEYPYSLGRCLLQ